MKILIYAAIAYGLYYLYTQSQSSQTATASTGMTDIVEVSPARTARGGERPGAGGGFMRMWERERF